MNKMTDFHTRLHKQFDEAAKRFRSSGAVWSTQIARKMIEHSKDYDSDVIEEVKRLLTNERI